jgi:hypothetical protein
MSNRASFAHFIRRRISGEAASPFISHRASHPRNSSAFRSVWISFCSRAYRSVFLDWRAAASLRRWASSSTSLLEGQMSLMSASWSLLGGKMNTGREPGFRQSVSCFRILIKLEVCPGCRGR